MMQKTRHISRQFLNNQVTSGQTLPALTVLAGSKVVRTVPVPSSVADVEKEVGR
jgi:hypothetical protein